MIVELSQAIVLLVWQGRVFILLFGAIKHVVYQSVIYFDPHL